MGRESVRTKHTHAEKHTDSQTARDRQAARQRIRQADRQTQASTDTHIRNKHLAPLERRQASRHFRQARKQQTST